MRTHRSFAVLFGATAFACLLGVTTPLSAAAGEMVAFKSAAARGTIVVRTNERRLYLVLGRGRALRYVVGVGRAGRQWSGNSFIRGKHLRPNWSPPAAIRRDRPDMPDVIPGGAPNNPMGVAALTLSGGEYAIHGTNAPKSIGGFVSYGCIRMSNRDIADLYRRVRVGTRVQVTR
jgi:lipoprotein-anchoring transpeptidase ErfK/SrfK